MSSPSGLWHRWSLPTLGALLLGATGALAGTAQADSPALPAPPPTMVQNTITGVTTVESIDRTTRQILLSDPSGNLLTVTMEPQMRNLAQLHAGDRVDITYQRAVAVQLAPPGGPLPSAMGEAGMTRAAAGQMPAGTVYAMMRVVVRVNSVDMAHHTVTFTNPNGTVHTVLLRTAAMQNFASQLKPGNNVRVDYLQSMTMTAHKP